MPRHARKQHDDTILTDAELATLRPVAEVFPPAVLTAERRGRGKQKAPTKVMVSLRLNRDVAKAYRATGPGWQSRVNALLAKHAPKAGPAAKPKARAVR